MASDYFIIQKSPFNLGSESKVFTFDLPGAFHTGARSILSFVLGSIKGSDDTLKLRVHLNGSLVYTYNANIDRPGHWSVHQVVGKDILRAGRVNGVAFAGLRSGGGTARISNVILWGYA